MSALVARLRAHWQLKLLSVGFAAALWLFVVSESRTEMVFTIPLDLSDWPAGLEVTSVSTDSVVVRVEGLRPVLDRLRDESFRAEVSLRGAKPGRIVAEIRPQNVTAPRGVRVLRVTPSRVRAALEPVAEPRD